MNSGLGRFKVVVPHLAAVLSRMKIAAGAVLCVIETRPAGRGVNAMRRIPCAGTKGVPSSVAPSTP